MNYKLLLLLIPILLVSCDPAFEVEYIINNQSNEHLLMTQNVQYFDSLDNFVEKEEMFNLHPDNKMIVNLRFGIGHNTRVEMDNTFSLPFDTVHVETASGKSIQLDVMDFSNWEKVYPNKDYNTGRIILELSNDDF